MAQSIIKISDLSVSDIKFGNVRKSDKGTKSVYLNHKDGGKLLLKLPPCRAPFGLSSFKDEKTGSVSYSLGLSVDKPEVAAIFNKINSAVVDFVFAHCEEIMGKKMSRDILADPEVFKFPFKASAKEGYAPVLNLKVITDPKTGVFKTESYDSSGTDVPLDTLEKGQSVSTLIELNQIWRSAMGVGFTYRVHQVKFSATNKLPSRALVESEDEVEEEEEEE